MAIQVILVDDHTLLRDGLARLLGAQQPDIEVRATFGTGRDAVKFTAEYPPDVAVIDIAMPDMNGIEVARQIHDASPVTQILMLSAYVDPEYVYQAILAGAQGYLVKDVAGRELIEAVRTVHAGRRYLCKAADTEALRQFLETRGADTPLGALSTREREVLQLTTEGYTIVETARKLQVSPKSVETYRFRLMKKLELEDIPALVKFAIRHGITSAERGGPAR